MSSDSMKNVLLDTVDGKTRDKWVAAVNSIHDTPMKFQTKKDINKLHVELEHTLEAITRATGKAMNLKLTSTIKTCEDCALGKAKKAGVNNALVERSKIKGE